MPDESRRGATEAPPQVFMPLLDHVTAHSMDEDYALVAARSDRPRKAPQEVRTGAAAWVVLALFGVLVATAAVQTARNADERSSSRESLVGQIRARSAQVDAQREYTADVRADIETLQRLSVDTAGQERTLATRLNRLGVSTGAAPVTGPGVKVVVDDAPGAVADEQRVLDEDLQKLVNALWASGAEAVAINGQRLSNLSAIRLGGSAITVNFVSLSRPYTVLAVGDPDTMPARFVETEHGNDWLDLRALYGLEFAMTSEEQLRLPATPARRLHVRHATAGETE